MKLSKIEVILLTISLFGTLLFFGYYIISGRTYEGASSDNTFVSFMMIVDIVPLFLFLKYLTIGGNKKNVALILVALIILIALYGLGVGVNDITFKSLLAYCTPAALIGILIAKSRSGTYFAKLLEPIMLFISLFGITSMRYLLTISTLQELGEEGIGAQSLSYYCGFAFALNLYFILFGDELPERFKYTKTTFYKYFSIGLLVVQFVVGLSTGGRGGFLLLLVSGIVLVFMRIRHHSGNSRKTVGTAFTFFLIVAAFVFAVFFMPENIGAVISRGSERTFSYMSNSGIDVSETSGRDMVYKSAIETIQDSPIIGHGILMKNTPFYGDRPHNIILEVLIQGGIIYLFFFMWFMLHLYNKMRKLIKRGHGLYMVPVALYPMVMLMFSSSYLGNEFFWFVISYTLCCDIPKVQRVYSPIPIGGITKLKV